MSPPMNSTSTTSNSRFQLSSVAFFGHTMAESLGLDLNATGCDPLYGSEPETITAQGKADLDACREQIRSNPGTLVYDDIEVFYRDKYTARG